MNIEKYETANAWFSAMHAQGFEVPIILCQAIETIMKKEKITFPAAYKIINTKNQITLNNKVFHFEAKKANYRT